MHRTLSAIAIGCALGACEPEAHVPFAPVRDGAVERPDGGPIRVRDDAGRDAGELDGGALDASGLDAGDGGTPPPRIDGVIEPGEWDAALEATSSTMPAPPFSSDRLTRVRVIRTSTRLYVAIEGTIGLGNALMMLLDADYGSENGTTLAGTGLSDFDGDLDRALSSPVWSTALAELRPDYAWGTTMMPFARIGGDATTGWREVASAPADFQRIGPASVSQCSTIACETSIVLGDGGIVAAGEIALLVRTGNTFGDLSPQTLPMDEPSVPETITRVLRIPAL
ncbi:MAG: hypothetical protein M3Y87_08275 [Myxococcota bacterium]|nr:hypothetical protein [Myxococcota bacterium]